MKSKIIGDHIILSDIMIGDAILRADQILKEDYRMIINNIRNNLESVESLKSCCMVKSTEPSYKSESLKCSESKKISKFGSF